MLGQSVFLESIKYLDLLGKLLTATFPGEFQNDAVIHLADPSYCSSGIKERVDT
jgi:hypothetical protein